MGWVQSNFQILSVLHTRNISILSISNISVLFRKALPFTRLRRESFLILAVFKLDYAGFVPSASWLHDLYDANVLKESPLLDQYMSMIPVQIGATDHSHKVCTLAFG